MKPVSLTYSLADQDFERTKSIGIFNVSLQLADALAVEPRLDRLTVLVNQWHMPRLNLPPHVAMALRDEAAGRGLQRILWDQWHAYDVARRLGNEWLLLPKGFSSFFRRCPLRLAVYVHDVMHHVYARNYPGALPYLERFYFQRAMRSTMQEAEVIFTNTEFTASEVRRVARESGLREPVVCCAGIGFQREADPVWPKENRVLVLTSGWPHKRSKLALAWVQRWQELSGFAGEIDLIGGLPKHEICPARAGWRHLPRVEEEDYRQLLRAARVLVYFSDYEGFGMPPVEATLAGVAAVYSDLPPTRESMGKAGLPFSNTDFESFRCAMDQAVALSPDVSGAWADQLLSRHTWDRVAQRIVTALGEAPSRNGK
jgi:glycosyltransferase involved in cell wall biosynthesis